MVRVLSIDVLGVAALRLGCASRLACVAHVGMSAHIVRGAVAWLLHLSEIPAHHGLPLLLSELDLLVRSALGGELLHPIWLLGLERVHGHLLPHLGSHSLVLRVRIP